MGPRRILVVIRIRGHRQQRVADVRRLRIALDVPALRSRPVVVLHHDHKHRLDVVQGRRSIRLRLHCLLQLSRNRYRDSYCSKSTYTDEEQTENKKQNNTKKKKTNTVKV